MENPQQIHQLLAHADWLSALATRLVRDGDADDVLQETWMAALSSHPPLEEGSARAWLSTVARNFARRRWRVTAARQRREQVVVEAPSEAPASSPEELLLRAQQQRTLADLVLALDEPFRGTIVMRYYEGKSAADIARALAIPAGTVRWRLKEAVDRLRARLDAQHDGDRERWRGIVGALALPALRPGKGLIVALTTKTKVLGAGLVLALLAGLTALSLFLFLGNRAAAPGNPVRHGPGPRALAAAAPAPLTARVQLSEEGIAGGGIDGAVRRPDGAPAAGAVVALIRAPVTGRPRGPRPAATALTDEGGRFTFEHAATGTYQVTATAHGHRAATSPAFALEMGQRHQLTLTLAEGGVTVSGRILDEGGGPIPRAKVVAGLGYPFPPARSGFSDRQYLTVADDQGRYQLTLDPREYTVRAQAGGYQPKETTVAVTRDVVRDLRLSPAARLAGRVIERASRQPVADCEVILSGGSFGSRVVRSDSEGRFVIDDAAPGSFQLVAKHRVRNLFAPGRKVAVVATQALEGLLIELDPGIRLGGRVRDASGAGLAGVPIDVWATDVGLGEYAPAVTGADGRFAVALLGPGGYKVSAVGGAASDARGEVNVALGPEGRDDVDLVLERAPRPSAVVGRVLGVDGRPVSGVLLQASATANSGRRSKQVGAAESGQDGQFRIEPVPSEPLQLLAWHPAAGTGEASVNPAAGGAPVEIRLDAGATIGGQVKFQDGAPAPGVSVAITRMGAPIIYDSTTSGPDGRFALRSLSAGRYTVRALRKAGPYNMVTSGEEPWMKLVEVKAGEQRQDVELELARGGRAIGGKVTLADGSPAVGAQVVAGRQLHRAVSKPSGQRLEHQATVDETGHFWLEDLEDDTFVLWASLPDHPDAESRDVQAGRDDVALVFPKPARVSGVVVTGDGRPVTAFHLSVVPAAIPGETADQRMRRELASREPPERVQNPEGAFAVALAAGSYELKVTTAGGGGRGAVTVAAGEHEAGLRLVVGSGLKATGKVVALESGTPIRDLTITLRTGGRIVDTRTAEDGGFVVEGLVPGEVITVHTQSSQLDDRIPEHLELKVPDAATTLDLGTLRLMAGDWRTAEKLGTTVGMRVMPRGGKPTVVNVPAPSPAAAAGIKEGDLLLAVNGRDVTGLGGGAIAYLMRQPAGSKVTVSLQTAAGEQRTVALTTVKR
jgi:RNA polymerase sigma factor (sigma-70 family)